MVIMVPGTLSKGHESLGFGVVKFFRYVRDIQGDTQFLCLDVQGEVMRQ